MRGVALPCQTFKILQDPALHFTEKPQTKIPNDYYKPNRVLCCMFLITSQLGLDRAQNTIDVSDLPQVDFHFYKMSDEVAINE